ncbi:DUF2724 domain-containing protein [Lelliottia amnigena]|nr:DUF2724 domain-containing protein [Lelliottia amnigena]
MLNIEPSFASLLVKQSPAMHCGHGWIIGKDGKRWHPSRSQDELLSDLSTNNQGRKKWGVLRLVCFISFTIKGNTTRFMKMSFSVATRLCQVMVATSSHYEMGRFFVGSGSKK